MTWRTIRALVVLGFGLTASAMAATSSPLADAVEKRDQAGVRTLLMSSSGVNAAQPDGTTALHWAAYHDDTEMAALLLKEGANDNAVNRYGMS
jgi:ankyrin repeat protein